MVLCPTRELADQVTQELRRLARGKMVATDTRSAFNQAMRVLTADRGIFATGGNLAWRTDRKVTQ
jgi:superfamily II DNA/RNA helicase